MNDQLRHLMAEIFEISAASIDEKTNQENLAEWTSLAHLRLITELESTFGVRVSMEQALGLTTFPALLEVVTAQP